jgi:predicted DNA-binding protein
MKVNVKRIKEDLKKEKTTLKSFRLSEELYEKFKKQCEKDGFSTARVIEKLIEQYLA